LAVGVVSLWFYLYLTGRLRSIDLEMENASLELLNQLSRLPSRFTVGATSDAPVFGEVSLDEVAQDDKFQCRCMLLAGLGQTSQPQARRSDGARFPILLVLELVRTGSNWCCASLFPRSVT
jgi:hypothetical protein